MLINRGHFAGVEETKGLYVYSVSKQHSQGRSTWFPVDRLGVLCVILETKV